MLSVVVVVVAFVHHIDLLASISNHVLVLIYYSASTPIFSDIVNLCVSQLPED
jgi:hypothetical protein